jgi:FHA domain-containing protein
MAQPNMAADADPLRSLNSAPKASAASEADRMSDLQRPFIPPTIIKPAVPIPAAAPVSAARKPWESLSQEEKTRTDATTLPPPPPASANAPPGRLASAARPALSGRAEDSAVLLEAFRRGLNAPALEMPALTPEMMELIGQLLHEAVGGTVDLLRARATLKHEMRADVTTVVPKDNNPLKFSPNAEVALQHLLAPPARGFTAAAPAMRAAFDDLRSHQFGLLAGMQAVLEAALQRFDPVALESKLGGRSRLHDLLPARRNARLWKLFNECYASIRKEPPTTSTPVRQRLREGVRQQVNPQLLKHRRGAQGEEGSRARAAAMRGSSSSRPCRGRAVATTIGTRAVIGAPTSVCAASSPTAPAVTAAATSPPSWSCVTSSTRRRSRRWRAPTRCRTC